MTSRALDRTSPEFPFLVCSTAASHPVAGSARDGGVLSVQDETRPGMLIVQLLPCSRIMAIVARGGGIYCERSTMHIRMAAGAGLLVVAPENALSGLLPIPDRMAILAGNCSMRIAQREPGCCMVRHTQG
jgi:hypothetical protein